MQPILRDQFEVGTSTFAGPAVERPLAVVGAGHVWCSLKGRRRACATARRGAVGAREVREATNCLHQSRYARDVQQRGDVRG